MAARVASLLVGISLLAAPDLLGYEGPVRASHLIVGPTAASIAVIAMSEVLRALRWVNLALGGWLILSALLLPHPPAALAVGITTGMALTLLALVRGPIRHQLGGGWPALFRDPGTRSGATNGE